MARRGRTVSATVLMLSTLARSVPAFLVRSPFPRALPTTSTAACSRVWPIQRGGAPQCLAKGFGETPKPAKTHQPAKGKALRPAKSLMPLADAASKLLPKSGADGKVKFDNPGVGDFQVLDALVEVRSQPRRLLCCGCTRVYFFACLCSGGAIAPSCVVYVRHQRSYRIMCLESRDITSTPV